MRGQQADGPGAVPDWSGEGHSLLYAVGCGIWLLRRSGGKPAQIVGPRFRRGLAQLLRAGRQGR
jgi:hypothetical protein